MVKIIMEEDKPKEEWPKVVILECKYCDGSGRAPVPWIEKCPICKGTGKVKFSIEKGQQVVKCKICENTGKSIGGLSGPKKCSACEGSGWQVI